MSINLGISMIPGRIDSRSSFLVARCLASRFGIKQNYRNVLPEHPLTHAHPRRAHNARITARSGPSCSSPTAITCAAARRTTAVAALNTSGSDRRSTSPYSDLQQCYYITSRPPIHPVVTRPTLGRARILVGPHSGELW